MIRTLLALCASAIALSAVSCCCTSESAAPKLRSLPKFREIETTTPAPQQEVLHEK
jgi:hypothetical protein